MKKIFLFLGGLILMSGIIGCETKNKAEIEQSFDKVLAMYPTKNLEDFYDIEGYRDDEFDESDKGVWLLHSSMSISTSEDSGLASEGMLLRMNRNNRKAKGYYYSYTSWNDFKKNIAEKEKRYPVTYDEHGFHLVEELDNVELKEKIMNFQFFVQYGNFSKLDSYENVRKMYNSNVPMYELEYQLTNDDPNVQALKERYDIPTKKAPTLLLKGRGDLDGSSVGYKDIEIRFSKKPPVFFSDYIDFQPLSEEDIINE